MIQSQAYIFIMFILNGIIVGLLFDIFRIIRKTFKTSDFVTYIEDSIFWIMSGVFTLYFIFTFNSGEIRLYIFLGILLGIVLYILLISKYFVRVNTAILKIVLKMLSPFKKIIQKFTKKSINKEGF